MGLVKENYFVKKFGMSLSKAYALVDTQFDKLDNNTVRAYFNIQASRENAENLAPLEVKSIEFKVDRNKSLMAQAYEEAKKTVQIEIGWDYEKHCPIFKEIDGILTGWTNDIITEV